MARMTETHDARMARVHGPGRLRLLSKADRARLASGLLDEPDEGPLVTVGEVLAASDTVGE